MTIEDELTGAISTLNSALTPRRGRVNIVDVVAAVKLFARAIRHATDANLELNDRQSEIIRLTESAFREASLQSISGSIRMEVGTFRRDIFSRIGYDPASQSQDPQKN